MSSEMSPNRPFPGALCEKAYLKTTPSPCHLAGDIQVGETSTLHPIYKACNILNGTIHD